MQQPISRFTLSSPLSPPLSRFPSHNQKDHTIPSIYNRHRYFYNIDFIQCIDHLYSLTVELNERSLYLQSRQQQRRFEQHVVALMNAGKPPPPCLPPPAHQPECIFVNEQGHPIPTSQVLSMFRSACRLMTTVLRRFFHEQSMPSPEQSPVPIEQFEKEMHHLGLTESIDQDGLSCYPEVEPYIEWQYMQRFRFDVRDELYHSLDIITKISPSFWSNKDLLILSALYIEHFKCFPFTYHHVWNPIEMRNAATRERHKSVLEQYTRIVKHIIIWLLNLVVAKYQRNTAKQFILIPKEDKLEFIRQERRLHNGVLNRSSYFKPLSPRPESLETIDPLLPGGLPVTAEPPSLRKFPGSNPVAADDSATATGSSSPQNSQSNPPFGRTINGSNPDFPRQSSLETGRPVSSNPISSPNHVACNLPEPGDAAFKPADFTSGELEGVDDDVFEITPRVLTVHHNNSIIFDFDQDFLFTAKNTILRFCETQLRSNPWSRRQQRLIRLFMCRLKGKTTDWLKQQVLDYVCVLKRGCLFPRPPSLQPQSKLQPSTPSHPTNNTRKPPVSSNLNKASNSTGDPRPAPTFPSTNPPRPTTTTTPIKLNKYRNDYEQAADQQDETGQSPAIQNIPTTLTDREQEVFYEHFFFSNRNPTKIAMIPIDFTHVDDISSVYVRCVLSKCLRRILVDSQPPPDFALPSQFPVMNGPASAPNSTNAPKYQSPQQQMTNFANSGTPLKPESRINLHNLPQPHIARHPTTVSHDGGNLAERYQHDFEPSRESGVEDIDTSSHAPSLDSLHATRPRLSLSRTPRPARLDRNGTDDGNSVHNLPVSQKPSFAQLPQSGTQSFTASAPSQHCQFFNPHTNINITSGAENTPATYSPAGSMNAADLQLHGSNNFRNNTTRFNDDTDFSNRLLRTGLHPSKQQLQSQNQSTRSLHPKEVPNNNNNNNNNNDNNKEQSQSSQTALRELVAPQMSASNQLPSRGVNVYHDPVSTNTGNFDEYTFLAQPALSISTCSMQSSATINSTQRQPLFTQVFTDSFRHHNQATEFNGRSREMLWFDKLFETTFYDMSYCTYQLMRLTRLTQQYVVLNENNQKKLEALRLKQKSNYLKMQQQFKNHQTISYERRTKRGEHQMGIDIPLKHFYTKQLQTLTSRQQVRLTDLIREHGVIVLKRQQQLVVLERHVLRQIKQTIYFLDLLLRHWIKIHALQQFHVNGYSDQAEVLPTIDVPTRASRLFFLYTALHYTTLCSTAYYNYTRYFHSNPFSFSDLFVIEKTKTIQTVPRFDSLSFNEISPRCSVRLINGNSDFFTSFGLMSDLNDYKTFTQFSRKLGIKVKPIGPNISNSDPNPNHEFFMPGMNKHTEISFRPRRRRLDRSRLKRTLGHLTHTGALVDHENSSDEETFSKVTGPQTVKSTATNIPTPFIISHPVASNPQSKSIPQPKSNPQSTHGRSAPNNILGSLALETTHTHSHDAADNFSSDDEDPNSPNFILAHLQAQLGNNPVSCQDRPPLSLGNPKYYPEEEQCSDEEEGEMFFKSCEISDLAADTFYISTPSGSRNSISSRSSGGLSALHAPGTPFHEDKTPEIQNLRTQILSIHGQPQSGLFSITEGQSVSTSPLIKRKESIELGGSYLTYVVRELLVLISLYTCNCGLNSNQPSFQGVQSNGCHSELIDDFLDGKFQDFTAAQRAVVNVQSSPHLRTLYRHGDMYIVYVYLKLCDERNALLLRQGKQPLYSTTINPFGSIGGSSHSHTITSVVHSKIQSKSGTRTIPGTGDLIESTRRPSKSHSTSHAQISKQGNTSHTDRSVVKSTKSKKYDSSLSEESSEESEQRARRHKHHKHGKSKARDETSSDEENSGQKHTTKHISHHREDSSESSQDDHRHRSKHDRKHSRRSHSRRHHSSHHHHYSSSASSSSDESESSDEDRKAGSKNDKKDKQSSGGFFSRLFGGKKK